MVGLKSIPTPRARMCVNRDPDRFMSDIDILHRAFAISDQANNCRVGEETVILDARSGTYFGLDPVGSRIWNLIGQGLLPREACSRIAEEFGVPCNQVENDARSFLEDLEKHGIIS